jgi:hypothetical protein
MRFDKLWTKEQANIITKINKKLKVVRDSRFGGFNSPPILKKRLQFETSMKFFERSESLQKRVKKRTRAIKCHTRVLSEGLKNKDLTALSFLSL